MQKTIEDMVLKQIEQLEQLGKNKKFKEVVEALKENLIHTCKTTKEYYKKKWTSRGVFGGAVAGHLIGDASIIPIMILEKYFESSGFSDLYFTPIPEINLLSAACVIGYQASFFILGGVAGYHIAKKTVEKTKRQKRLTDYIQRLEK